MKWGGGGMCPQKGGESATPGAKVSVEKVGVEQGWVGCLWLRADIQSSKHVSRILRYCRDVLKVSTVFLFGLMGSPVLLFSAHILA